MDDAERLQIGHDRRGVVEAEIGGELDAVGGGRDRRGHQRLFEAPEHRPGRHRPRPQSPPHRFGSMPVESLRRDALVRQVGDQPQRRAVAEPPVGASAGRRRRPSALAEPRRRQAAARSRCGGRRAAACTSASRCGAGAAVALAPVEHRALEGRIRRAGRGPRRRISRRRRRIPCGGPGAPRRRDRRESRRRTGTAPASPIPRP